ncbi:MAG: hypothetical protein H7Z75_06040, partial [Ferruginibacter sp.]|nr:hypothetical protein [Cytophagales bacterium]
MPTVTKRSILLRFFREHRLLSSTILLVGLLNNCITLLLPISVGKYYELVFGTDSSRTKALAFLGLNAGMTVPYFLAFFTGLIVVRGIFEFVEKYLTGMAAEFFAKDLRERLFSHQLIMDLAAHRKKEVGKYLMRYGGDLKSIR